MLKKLLARTTPVSNIFSIFMVPKVFEPLKYTLNVNLLRLADSVSSYSEHSGAEALSEHVFSFLKLNLNHF